MTTKVSKWGNSLAIRIPDEFAENLNLSDGSVIGFKQSGDNLIITKARPKYSLKELLKGMTAKNSHKLFFADDKPRGQEVW